MLSEIVKTNGDVIAAIREFCTAPVFEMVTQVSGKETPKFDEIKIPRPKHPDFDITFDDDEKAETFFGRPLHIALGVLVCGAHAYYTFGQETGPIDMDGEF